MIRALVLIAAIALSACTTKTVKDPQATREFVFPYGTYQHDVDLSVAQVRQDQPKEFHFHGVVKVNAELINLVALSPMNTTLFRMREDRKTGKIETEIFIDALKKAKEQMADYESLIGSVLTARSQDVGEKPLVLATPQGPAQVYFHDFDKNQVPALVIVESPKFKLKIRVSGYEI